MSDLREFAVLLCLGDDGVTLGDVSQIVPQDHVGIKLSFAVPQYLFAYTGEPGAYALMDGHGIAIKFESLHLVAAGEFEIDADAQA